MTSHLLYKEWIKSWRFLIFLFIVFACCIAYIFIDISLYFKVRTPVQVWDLLILRKAVLVTQLKYLPVAAGVILACCQYIPEMLNKEIKLTLHLPMREPVIISVMLAYGVGVLAILFLLTVLALTLGLSHYFCREIILYSLAYLLPYLLSGIFSYLLTTWIVMEPSVRYRMLLSLVSLCLAAQFFLTEEPGAYLPAMLFFSLMVVLSFVLPFSSAVRLKKGIQ